MTVRRVGLLALAGLALVLVAAETAGARDRLIARTTDPQGVFSLAAYRGTLVWDSTQTVYSWSGGAVRTLATTPPQAAFGSVDLGRGQQGGTVGVIEHCDVYDDNGFQLCNVFRLSTTSGRTTPVRGGSSTLYEERFPAVWKRNVVFVRTDFLLGVGPDSGQAHAHAGLFMTAPLSRLAGLERAPDPICRSYSGGNTDLVGHTAAYCTETASNSLRPRDTIIVKRFDRRGRGRACVVAWTVGKRARLMAPVLDGDYVYWLRLRHLDESVRPAIHRRRLPTPGCGARGKEQSTHAPSALLSFAVDGGKIFYSTGRAIYQAQSARSAHR